MPVIRAFIADDLERFVAFYARQTSAVPYTPRLTEELFSRRVLRHPCFAPEDLLVAIDADEVVGFVHVGSWPKPRTITPMTGWLGPFWEFDTIVNLQFPADAPELGDRLIRSAEERSRVKKRSRFAAFSRLGGYLFYKDLYLAGEPLCWDGSVHVQDGLVRAGYIKTEPTRLMGMRLKKRPMESRAKIDIDIEIRDVVPKRKPAPFMGFAGLPGRMVMAYHKGELAGSCGFARLENSVTVDHGKPVASFGMGTVERFQRQGVGTCVLTRALGLMWDEGVRKVVLQTGDDNLPAVRLYEALGFKTEPAAHAHGFKKDPVRQLLRREMVKIVVVDGASSSGKTSLVDRFALRASGRYRKFHIDDFIKTMPSGLWIERSRSDEGWAEIGKDFTLFLKREHEAFEHVIADAFYKTTEARDHLFNAFGRSNVYYVQLFCGLEELDRRERERGDRRPGLARSQFDLVYQFSGFDARIDSTDKSVDECVEELIRNVSPPHVL